MQSCILFPNIIPSFILLEAGGSGTEGGQMWAEGKVQLQVRWLRPCPECGAAASGPQHLRMAGSRRALWGRTLDKDRGLWGKQELFLKRWWWQERLLGRNEGTPRTGYFLHYLSFCVFDLNNYALQSLLWRKLVVKCLMRTFSGAKISHKMGHSALKGHPGMLAVQTPALLSISRAQLRQWLPGMKLPPPQGLALPLDISGARSWRHSACR